MLDVEDEGLEDLLEKIGGSHTTAMNRLRELLVSGLVEKFVTPRTSRRVYYRLTAEGRKIAALVQEAENKLRQRLVEAKAAGFQG